MANTREKKTNTSNDEKRAQQVYEYIKRKSKEIQKRLNSSAPVEAKKN